MRWKNKNKNNEKNELKSLCTAIKIYVWYIKWEICMIIFFLKPYKYRIYEIYIGICVNTTAQKKFLKASYKPINNGHLLWDQELKDEGGISFLSWFTLLHYVVFFKR